MTDHTEPEPWNAHYAQVAWETRKREREESDA